MSFESPSLADRPLPRMAYDSAGAPPGEGFEVWREMFGPQVETQALGPYNKFHAALEFCKLGEIVFHTACFSAVRLDRTRRHVATGPFDGITLQLVPRGRETIRSGHHEFVLDGGRALITDWAQPRQSITTDCTQITVAFPRPRIDLRDRLPHGGSLCLELATPEGRLIEQSVRSIQTYLPHMTQAQAPVVGESLLWLVNEVIAARMASVDLDLAQQRATLPAMKAWLSQRLAMPELGVRSLMQAFHVSRPTVYRLFQPCGGVHRFIREQRLAAILRGFTAEPGPSVSVPEVARRWGYDDTCYFYRVFKQHYGCTPREAQRAAAEERDSISFADKAPRSLSWQLYDWLAPVA